MCIIVYKPENKEFPTWATLETCFNNNPDGCGYMFVKNNQVNIRKGFMTFKQFKKALKQDKQNCGINLPYVMHFRITTHGGTSPQMCQPFPVFKTQRKI